MKHFFSKVATVLLVAPVLLTTSCNLYKEIVCPKDEPKEPVPGNFYSSFISREGSRSYKSADGSSIGSGIYYGSTPTDLISATAVGDVNGDGKYEYFTAMNTAIGPYIYRSNDANSLGKPIYTPEDTQFRVVALALGDVDKDGKDELFSAFNATGEVLGSKIYRSEDGHSIMGEGGSCIYTSDVSSITALTAGDINGDKRDELFTGLMEPEASIYRSENGNSIGAQIYQEPNSFVYFTIVALACGDLDGNKKDELYTGFNSPADARVYRSEDGNSITGGGGARIYYNPSSQISALAAGNTDEKGNDELYTGLMEDKAAIYRSDNKDAIGSPIYQDPNGYPYFTVTALSASGGF
jgi:hypothetical protein